MAGGVIATVGLLAAAFSTNVAMLSATLGGIGGRNLCVQFSQYLSVPKLGVDFENLGF